MLPAGFTILAVPLTVGCEPRQAVYWAHDMSRTHALAGTVHNSLLLATLHLLA